MATTASAPPAPPRALSAQTFLDIINPLGLLNEAKQLTPREFLRDFYTRRGFQDKLKDVDALVAAYGHQMPQLYIELDKKYGTSFVTNPPPVINEVHQGEPVMQYVTPVTPKAPLTKAQSHKIVLLGNSGVGKTNLLSRLNKGEFSTEFTSTIGVEFLTHKMHVNDVEVKAQIWDTAGQERFHAMMATYYRKAVGALLIFDVRDRQSLLGVEKWLDQLLNVAEPGLHAVLVGNKCDLAPPERVVSTEEAEQFASAHHMQYIETSAKTGHNVEEAFHTVIASVHRAHMAELMSQEMATVNLAAKNGERNHPSASIFDGCNHLHHQIQDAFTCKYLHHYAPKYVFTKLQFLWGNQHVPIQVQGQQFSGGNTDAPSGTAMDKFDLGKFNPEEQDAMPDLLEYANGLLRLYLHHGVAQATTVTNSMDLAMHKKEFQSTRKTRNA